MTNYSLALAGNETPNPRSFRT